MEIMLSFGSWNQAQHNWQRIISVPVEKAIPPLCGSSGFLLWNQGLSSEQGQGACFNLENITGGGRTWETITRGGFLFHPLGSVILKICFTLQFQLATATRLASVLRYSFSTSPQSGLLFQVKRPESSSSGKSRSPSGGRSGRGSSYNKLARLQIVLKDGRLGFELWAFQVTVVMDDAGVGTRSLLLFVENFPCSVKDFLFTHGEAIKTRRQMEQVGPSFKAEWFPSVFDIETGEAFRQLTNYCFHRGNHNKWFVSCCLTKITTGTVNGKSNLHLLPTGMNCEKQLIKRWSYRETRGRNTKQLKGKKNTGRTGLLYLWLISWITEPQLTIWMFADVMHLWLERRGF